MPYRRVEDFLFDLLEGFLAEGGMLLPVDLEPELGRVSTNSYVALRGVGDSTYEHACARRVPGDNVSGQMSLASCE